MPRLTKIAQSVLSLSQDLVRTLEPLHFSEPITHIYNPYVYAWDGWSQYVGRYGSKRKRIVFMGMNPGPWGMSQTGVPFGEVDHIKNWLKIKARICKPENEHPKRQVDGFACTRSEVSGQRLWGFFKDKFVEPMHFFEEHMILNYCPLVFMEETGRNFTPDKLSKSEAEPLFDACDQYIRDVVALYRPEWLVGVGAFAEKRLKKIFKGEDRQFAQVLHPSPASPLANRGWASMAEKQLLDQGVWT